MHQRQNKVFRYLMIMVFLVSIHSSCSQETERSIGEDNLVLVAQLKYEYKKQERLSTIIQYKPDGSFYWKKVNSYNDQGILVSYQTYLNSPQERNDKVVYKLNEDQKIQESKLYTEGINLKVHKGFEYDEEGRMIKEFRLDHPMYPSTIYHTYAKDGTWEVIEHKNDDGDLTGMGKDSIVYDSKGFMIQKDHYYPSNDYLIRTDREVNSVDESGLILEQQMFDKNNLFEGSIVFHYNEEKQLLMKLSTTQNGNEDFREEMTYDDKGFLIEKRIYSYAWMNGKGMGVVFGE